MSSATGSSPAVAPPALVVRRYMIVPSNENAPATGPSTKKRAANDMGETPDLTPSRMVGQRLFSYFPSAEVQSAPSTLRVNLPEDLFATRPANNDEDEEEDEDGGAPVDETSAREGVTKGTSTRPRERLAVLSGSGTSGTAKSLQWATRKLQERTTYTATPTPARREAPLVHLHATPLWEYKDLSCLLVKLPVTPRDHTASSSSLEAVASLVEGPLVGLYCDRIAPTGAAGASERGISSAWEHAAVKVKKGDWKNMDAVIKEEAEDRGRLQMVLADDTDVGPVPPRVKKPKTESTTARPAAKPAAQPVNAGRSTKVNSPPPPPPLPIAIATPTPTKVVTAPKADAPPTPVPTPASSSGEVLAAVAESILQEIRHEGKQVMPFKEWQKLVLKRLPEYREISAHMKSPETRHVATQWFEAMKERLRAWLTAEKGLLIDPQGNVVGY